MKHLAEKVIPIRGWLSGVEAELKSRGNEPKYPLSTLPGFSRKIWGLKEGLTIIGARTSQGKSSFSMQIARDLADQRIPTLFLSLEMTVDNIIERLFCSVMKIDNYEVLRGRLSTYMKEWEFFKKYVAEIPLLIVEGVGQTFSDVNLLVEHLNPKPRCIIIDFIQAIRRGAGDSREMLNEYIRKFRELALKHRFVGILCSQINRAIMQEKVKEPTLHTLKETGCLEENADNVYLLHWDNDMYSNEISNDYKIIIAKSRNGRTGFYRLSFYPQYYLFTEPEVPAEVKQLQMAGII